MCKVLLGRVKDADTLLLQFRSEITAILSAHTDNAHISPLKALLSLALCVPTFDEATGQEVRAFKHQLGDTSLCSEPYSHDSASFTRHALRSSSLDCPKAEQ